MLILKQSLLNFKLKLYSHLEVQHLYRSFCLSVCLSINILHSTVFHPRRLKVGLEDTLNFVQTHTFIGHGLTRPYISATPLSLQKVIHISSLSLFPNVKTGFNIHTGTQLLVAAIANSRLLSYFFLHFSVAQNRSARIIFFSSFFFFCPKVCKCQKP